MPKYQLIYLNPNPFTDQRILVGAVVRLEKETQFVRTAHMPCEACLRMLGGSERIVPFLRGCLADIEQDVAIGRLPSVRRLGQAWHFSVWRDVHPDIADPIEWMRRLLAPAPGYA